MKGFIEVKQDDLHFLININHIIMLCQKRYGEEDYTEITLSIAGKSTTREEGTPSYKDAPFYKHTESNPYTVIVLTPYPDVLKLIEEAQ